jgi:hypothetical protein
VIEGNKSEILPAEQDAWRRIGSLRREVEETALDPEEMDRIYDMAQEQRQVSTASDFGGGEASYQMASADDNDGGESQLSDGQHR